MAAYITPADMYAEGLSEDEYDSAWVTGRIKACQRIIEHVTGKWFDGRVFSVFLDGNCDDEIALPMPAHTLTEVALQEAANSYQPYSLLNFVLYGSPLDPLDKISPRLAINKLNGLNMTDAEVQIETFPRGTKNIRITATWGYVDETGAVPEDIKLALKLLTRELIGSVGDDEMQAETERRGLKREDVDDYESEWFEGTTIGSTTGNKSVDMLLRPYMGRAGSGIV